MAADAIFRKAGTPVQVAALPLQVADDGRARVLLVTARDTKRWIIPKGWPMKGRKPHEAAAQEALEEAGLVGTIGKEPIGSYLYPKRRTAHLGPCRVDVFVLLVKRQRATWPEKGQRELRWVTIEEAVELVEEAGLAELLRHLDLSKVSGLDVQANSEGASSE